MNFAKLGLGKHDFGQFTENAIDGNSEKKNAVQNNMIVHPPNP